MSFVAAKNAGIQFVELAQQWDEIETANGEYNSPFASIANKVYPPLDTAVVLSMNPIDTMANRVPKHLESFDWDSEQRVQGFIRWFDWTCDQLSDVEILAVSVGNEIDAYLTGHPDEMDAYARFFQQVATHIRKRYPDAFVGSKFTFSGRTGELNDRFAKIDSQADAIMLTYYPLDDQFHVRMPGTVAKDFETMLQLSEDRPILLLETGYPSGTACNSTEKRQAEFVDQLFAAWDRHLDRIPMVNLVWTCDLPKSEVDAMVNYYGIQQPGFRTYLSTLGLRTASGRDKLAFKQVRKLVRKRAKDAP